MLDSLTQKMILVGFLLMSMPPTPNGEEISNRRKLFAEENWMVMGDFNTPLKESEKWGVAKPI